MLCRVLFYCVSFVWVLRRQKSNLHFLFLGGDGRRFSFNLSADREFHFKGNGARGSCYTEQLGQETLIDLILVGAMTFSKMTLQNDTAKWHFKMTLQNDNWQNEVAAIQNN